MRRGSLLLLLPPLPLPLPVEVVVEVLEVVADKLPVSLIRPLSSTTTLSHRRREPKLMLLADPHSSG
jgi:hypothetical protein